MGWAMPNPKLRGTTYYFCVHVPRDVAKKARGTVVAVPLGDEVLTRRVGSVVKFSLQTKDPREAKRRFTQALSAVERHWEALRRGPAELTHKQCVALAGEVRRDWIEILDEDPGTPEMWRHVRRQDKLATVPTQSRFAELMVRPKPKPSNRKSMEERFGGFADVALRRHGLVVDEESRWRLVQQIARAMDDVTRINLKKAEGDYSETGETNAYPEFAPRVTPKTEPQQPTGRNAKLTFAGVIDVEVKRRAAGKNANPLPERTARKFRLAADEFSRHRKSEDIATVTARQAEDWKLSMLERGKLSNNTIAQRLQNVATVIDWARKQSLGDLFPDGNPLKLVERPKAAPRDSSERTLRLEEARTILRAARKANKPELRWLPWMMAYSGARVEELAQLTQGDFFQLSDDWFYRVTTRGQKSVKNAYGIRRVPVHPDLVKEGLIEFLKKHSEQPKQRLFPARSQANLWSWVRNEVGLSRKELAPNHGWRHLFEDMALAAGMDATAKHYITGRTTGHSSEGYGKSDAMLPALAAQMKRLPSYLES